MNACRCGCGSETRASSSADAIAGCGSEPPRAAQPLDDRIRNNSIITVDGHWLWQLRIDQQGYGQIKINKVSRPVARVSYEVFVTQVPEGLLVHQTCGRRDCVAPDHLEAITHVEMIGAGQVIRSVTSPHTTNGDERPRIAQMAVPGMKRTRVAMRCSGIAALAFGRASESVVWTLISARRSKRGRENST